MYTFFNDAGHILKISVRKTLQFIYFRITLTLWRSQWTSLLSKGSWILGSTQIPGSTVMMSGWCLIMLGCTIGRLHVSINIVQRYGVCAFYSFQWIKKVVRIKIFKMFLKAEACEWHMLSIFSWRKYLKQKLIALCSLLVIVVEGSMFSVHKFYAVMVNSCVQFQGMQFTTATKIGKFLFHF